MAPAATQARTAALMPTYRPGRRPLASTTFTRAPNWRHSPGTSAFSHGSAVVQSIHPGAPPWRFLFLRRFQLRSQRRLRGLRSRPCRHAGKGTECPVSFRGWSRTRSSFREVNERVRETLGRDEGLLDFVCECGNEDCIDRVTLDVSEYERVRSNATLFLIATGHERLHLERVVDQGEGYLLIQKTVDVDTVERADPRSRDD
jgi:hypothetical protein